MLSLFAFGPTLAAPPPIEAYGKLPAVEHVSLSPSGQRYAFVAVIGDTRRLVAETVDGSKVLVATEVGTAKVVGVSWAGEDHLLVEISHTVPLGFGFTVSKLEMSTVVVINLQTRKAFVVFDHHPTVSTAVLGGYGVAQIKGHWYGFFGFTYLLPHALWGHKVKPQSR